MRLGQHFHRVAALVLIIFSLTAPQRAAAHGETLIRIAEVTAQIESAPTNLANLYLLRGDLHREHQDWIAAEADYGHAAKLEPHLTKVQLSQADLLADTGRLEAAESMFTKVIAEHPGEGEAFIGRARVRLKLDQRKPAISDFQRGIERLRNPLPEYFLRWADALVADARSAEALHALESGIHRLGPLVPLLSSALELELENKNFEAALLRVNNILEVIPRKENWLARRGGILLLADRPAQAKESFTAALKAIDSLPPRLQQTPAMLKLIDHIRAALSQATPRPAITNND